MTLSASFLARPMPANSQVKPMLQLVDLGILDPDVMLALSV